MQCGHSHRELCARVAPHRWRATGQSLSPGPLRHWANYIGYHERSTPGTASRQSASTITSVTGLGLRPMRLQQKCTLGGGRLLISVKQNPDAVTRMNDTIAYRGWLKSRSHIRTSQIKAQCAVPTRTPAVSSNDPLRQAGPGNKALVVT